MSISSDEILSLRTQHPKQLTLDDACAHFQVDPQDITKRLPIWKAFQALEQRGLCKAIVGRRGGVTRLEWSEASGAAITHVGEVAQNFVQSIGAVSAKVANTFSDTYRAPYVSPIQTPSATPHIHVETLTAEVVAALQLLHKAAGRFEQAANDVRQSAPQLAHQLDILSGRTATVFMRVTALHPNNTTVDSSDKWKRTGCCVKHTPIT